MMAEPLRNDIDLHPLFKKLGHDVEEIRTRSMKNIVSKLSHGLICEADLVQERHLLVRLLEWFNFHTVPCQGEVLALIQRLAKHGSSAKIFVELGAVSFLSKLRPDCHDDLHPLIDDIIETLLSLPCHDDNRLLMQKRECVYQQQQHTGAGEDVAFDPSNMKSHDASQASVFTTHQPTDRGYFALQDTVVSQPQQDRGNQGVKGLKFCTFPWLSLTHTDRHVLLSTNSLLCGSRPNLVATSCEFISDVVLQDFPAEIFLQRPSIVKSLLSLLGVKPLGETDSEIAVGAARCLRDLAVLILSRYRFYHDPSLYCPKQEFGSVPSSSYTSSSGRASRSTSQSTLSSNSRPSIIGRNDPRPRGDGQDLDSPSSVGTASPVIIASPPSLPSSDESSDTDSEDALSLQFSQLTLPQFTVETLSRILTILKTSSPEVMLAAVQLLYQIGKLMNVTMTMEIWEDKSVAGRNLTEKLYESFESLGEVLEYHQEHCSRSDGEDTVSTLAIQHHRMSFVVLAGFTLQMIQDMVPVQKAGNILPDSVVSAITLLVMDQSLVHCVPQTRPVLGVYLENLDGEKYQLYQDALKLCKSLESTVAFLRDSHKTVNDDLLALASSSLPSLPYHPDSTFVSQFIKVYSQICRNLERNLNDSALIDGRKTLLKLLSHLDPDIRQCVYKECLSLVKKSLNVDQAVKAHSDACYAVRFLADGGVLYEISCYGLNDSNKEVCSCARDIVLHLLQGKLLMQSQLWQETTQAIIPSLPVLQCHAGRETILSRCVLGLYEAPLVTSAAQDGFQILPKLEKLRGALRLFFSKDESVRREAARSVLWYLTQDPDRGRKLPSVSNPVLTDMADLFLMEHPVVLDDSRERSVFQVDGLVKVYNIYSSKDTEPSLKKSAAEQIAIMLQDVTLHKAFTSNNGIEKTLEYLEQAIDASSTKQVAMVTLIPACLSILRHVLHEDSSSRHELAHRFSTYYIVLRSTLLCHSDSRARYQGSHLMVLLLFDEVAGPSSPTKEEYVHHRFALPQCVVKRYQLPFRCTISQATSAHRIKRIPDPDPMLEPLPLRMLRIAWNIAMHDGIDGLITDLEKNSVETSQGEEGQTNILHLDKSDQLVLQHSHIDHSLSQALAGITQASSHHQVKLSLWHLSLWLTAGLLLASDDGPDITVSPAGRFLLLDWKDVLRRFVEVVPANTEDKLLLAEVLRFLTNLMQSLRFVPDDLLDWLGEISCGKKSVLMTLLSNYAANHQAASGGLEEGGRRPGEEEGAPHRVLHKQLLTFFDTFVRCLSLADAWRHKGRYLGGSLTHGLLTSLNMTDALPFYDLPPLEGTLHCLVHVTARCGWSLDWTEGDSLSLCHHLLNSLVEVVSAFHVGRGGTAMSYMGKGVTKSATLCLQHLTYEMSIRALDQDWSSHWFETRQGKGPDWLMALWSYRDPEVRAAGLCMAASLISTEEGCITMAMACQHLPAGLWGVAFGMLMDQSECSMVREQAANLLCNLLSRPFPDQDVDHTKSNKRWAGPQVHDEQSQTSLSGQPALLALLHHYHFYHGVASMLQHYYGQCTIQPVSVVEESTISTSVTPSGPSTVTTPGSNRSLRSSLSTPTIAQHTWLNDDVTGIPNTTSVTPSPPTLNGQHGIDRPVPNFQSNMTDTGEDLLSPIAGSPNHSSAAARFSSVVTPCLVSAVCRVLRNVLVHVRHDAVLGMTKEDILASLLRLFNSSQLHELFQQYNNNNSPSSVHSDPILELQLYKHLTTYQEILMLCKVCLMQGQANMGNGREDAVFINCLHLLQLRIKGTTTDCDVWLSITKVWEGTFDMIKMHLHVGGSVAWEQMLPLFVSHWDHITACIVYILKNVSPSSTRISALNFLTMVMSQAGNSATVGDKGAQRMHQGGGNSSTTRTTSQSGSPGGGAATGEPPKEITLSQVLDAKVIRQDGDSKSPGARLCQVLLQAYDGILPRSNNPLNAEKPSVLSALNNLLAVSREAQEAALEGGLVESTVNCMRDVHTKLTMDSLHINKSSKKKEEPHLLCELSDQIQLLDNCMHGNTDVKMAAYQAGLTTVVHKLWAWCTSDRKLLTGVLAMLTTYIARCPTACGSLATSPPGQTGGSLLHSLVRQSQREKLKMDSAKSEDHPVADRLFNVLSNAVWSSECRNVLWKSGFLQGFAQILPPKKKKLSINVKRSAALWLRLLVSLTFATEGQQMVMKIPGCLDLFMEYGQCNDSSLQYLAVIILHNLCFLNANKAKLLGTDKLVSFLLERLQCNSTEVQFAILNALWVLIQGSQKAKAVLKASNLLQRLLILHGQLRQDSALDTSSRSSKCHQIITNLQLAINE